MEKNKIEGALMFMRFFFFFLYEDMDFIQEWKNKEQAPTFLGRASLKEHQKDYNRVSARAVLTKSLVTSLKYNRLLKLKGLYDKPGYYGYGPSVYIFYFCFNIYNSWRRFFSWTNTKAVSEFTNHSTPAINWWLLRVEFPLDF